MIRRLFGWLLGGCLGAIIAMFAIKGAQGLDGTAAIAILVLATLFGGSIASKIIGRSVKDMEDAVHGKPRKAVSVFIFWLVVLACGIVALFFLIGQR